MHSPLTPSPRDWPEDAIADPDNGAYTCHCFSCESQFIGHKRRMCCKVCAALEDAEMERRLELMVKAGLDPEGWKLMSRTEWDTHFSASLKLMLALCDERALRRKLAAALKVADQTNSNVAYWGHPGRHRDTSEALLAESAKLDEMKS